MKQEFKNRAMLRRFVNIMPDNHEAPAEFERVYNEPIFEGAKPEDYFARAEIFRRAWTSQKPEEQEEVSRNLEAIFDERRARPADQPSAIHRALGAVPSGQIKVEVKFGNPEFPITIQPRDLLDRLVLILLTSPNLGICGNPQCPEKYFVATDRKQKYCSYDCSDVRRRQAKLEWWQSKGDKWRKSRTKKKGRKAR